MATTIDIDSLLLNPSGTQGQWFTVSGDGGTVPFGFNDDLHELDCINRMAENWRKLQGE